MTNTNKPILDIEHPSFSIEYQYPYPISDLYKRYKISINPVDKLGYMISTIEVSIRFLVSLGLTINKGNRLKVNISDIDVMQPTLGTWKLLFERLLPVIYEKLGHKEELILFGFKARQIIQMRNNFAHGATISEDNAILHLDQNKNEFIKALECLNLLKNYLLVVPEKMEVTRNPSGFNTVVRICRGCNSHFQFDMWNTKSPLYPNTPLLVSLENSISYLLLPIMRVIKNRNNGINNFYFYSKKERDEAYVWQTFEYFTDNMSYGDQDLNIELKTLFENTLLREDGYGYISKVEFNSLPNFFSFSHGNTQKMWFEMPGEYSLIGKIGEGRFSEVYKVKHNFLNEVRVLKIPKINTITDYKVMTRFDTEAKILSKLKDTQTSIRLYEYNKNKDGIPYIIEELGLVGTLEEFSNRWGVLSWQEVVEIGYDCFKKLQIIHNNGILHRDIKPSNILVNDNFERLFCDFGVGKMFELERDITSDGDNLGTYIYMPPEQKEGKSETRSDFYSLGVCLIVLLAAEIPISPRDWMYANNKNLPEEFAKLLIALVEPIIENRPKNINAILQVLGVLRKRANHPSPSDLIKEENRTEKTKKPQTEIKIWVSPDQTEFRFIPKGEFIMGGTKYPDERPVHKVILTDCFFMATTAVTNLQFSEFVKSTRYRNKDKSFLRHLKNEGGFSNEWRNPDAPVVFVSWVDAKEYVLWRSEKDNKDYRLPTEAEWEYVSRAGNRYVYSWGNNYDNTMMNVGNIIGYPTPVGSYPPNDWGIYDLLGNVWEWCEDYFDVRPDEESVYYKYCSENFIGGVQDPVNTGMTAIISKNARPQNRSGRGGSFFSEKHNCRPANRRGEFQDKCTRSFGFRLIVKGIKDEEAKIL